MAHAPTWHIRCGDNSKACYLDGYTLLPLCANHSAIDALEWARGDKHLVTTLETAVVMR